MKHIKLILIVTIVIFAIAASVLVFAGTQKEVSNVIDLPLSDLVQTDPIRFEALKSVRA